jgi:hypothetical protein
VQLRMCDSASREAPAMVLSKLGIHVGITLCAAWRACARRTCMQRCRVVPVQGTPRARQPALRPFVAGQLAALAGDPAFGVVMSRAAGRAPLAAASQACQP